MILLHASYLLIEWLNSPNIGIRMLKIYQKYYFSLKSHYFLYLFVRYILRFWELTHQSGDSPNERVQFPFVVAGKVHRLKLITLKIPQYRTSLNLEHLETSVFPEHPPILNNPPISNIPLF